ncbi:hypothetical protein P8C59_003219 [Phyllachora maydis]|uniref:Uncharacterized protein n=1 Tax=Phyllachora maydis TaxID=1825666 RepID=A0AAD9I1E1_9PEZI|nr:hypothetical protein P8C59_003219 [Phyllachora maydis]
MSCKYYIKPNIDSFSNLDNLAYTIPVPTLAKPAKITLAIRCAAAYKAKRRELAKACTTAAKKEGLQCSKRTTSSNASRNTTNSSLIANKDNNNAYNRVYIPPADTEEEKGSSSDNNGVNSSTSNSADKGKGSSVHKHSKGALRYKDTLLHKRQYVASYPYSPSSD